MRRIELEAALEAPATEAWRVLVDLQRWPQWGRLVTSAQGHFVPGAVWTVRLRGEPGGTTRTMRPQFVEMTPPQRVVFETRLGAGWLVKLRHTFEIRDLGSDRSTLRQSFEASGLLVPILWHELEPGMTQFAEFGQDLARRLARA